MISFIDFRKMIIGIVICGFIGIGSVFGQDIWSQSQQASSSYTLGYAKFAKGTCTEYAASRRKDLFPSRSGKDRRFGGNAISRLSNAKKAGVPTGKQPKVWAIAVFWVWGWAWSSYGHVAIVEKVIDDTTIVVSDMNYAGRNRITKRTISDPIALGYIYTLPQKKTTDLHQTKTNIIILALSTKQLNNNVDIQAGSVAAAQTNWSSSLPHNTVIYNTKDKNWIPNDTPIELWDIQISLMMDNRSIIRNLSEQHRARTYTAMIIKEYSNNNSFSIKTIS